MPSSDSRLERALREGRSRPSSDLVDRLAAQVVSARPARGRSRPRVAAALGIGVAVLAAAVSLGALSRTADVARRTIDAVEGAAAASDTGRTRPSAADTPAATSDTPAAAGADETSSSASTAAAAPVTSASVAASAADDGATAPPSEAATGPGATTPAADLGGVTAAAQARFRSLASLVTYQAGSTICHWTTAANSYNNQTFRDVTRWQAIVATSQAVFALHAGDLRDYYTGQGTDAAGCAAQAPAP